MPSAADMRAMVGVAARLTVYYTAMGVAGLFLCEIHVRKQKARKRNAIIELWSAAQGGDVTTVSRLLRSGRIHQDACHPESNGDLVLDIARVTTCSEQLDESLAHVLHALRQAGWSFKVNQIHLPVDNALHFLASQPTRFKVQQRCWVLMEENPDLATGRGKRGKTVYDIVAATRPDLQEIIKRR